MLLEEVILHFLGANGYVAIDEADRDPTDLLVSGSVGVGRCIRSTPLRATALRLHFPIRIGSL